MASPLTNPMPDIGERMPVVANRSLDGTFERPTGLTATGGPRVRSGLVGRHVA